MLTFLVISATLNLVATCLLMVFVLALSLRASDLALEVKDHVSMEATDLRVDAQLGTVSKDYYLAEFAE